MHKILLLVGLVGLAACAHAQDPVLDKAANHKHFLEWAALKKPVDGPPTPIGGYDAGCLAGAVKIDDGPGYVFMHLKRHRFFGHPLMKDYLAGLGEKLHGEKMPYLLVGDVGAVRGGPMISGHASHQIGLDADIWLTMSKKKPNTRDRERMSSPSFVIGRKHLKKTWGKTQIAIVEAAASFDSVARIFVSPPIKRYFCDEMPDAPWLYKLRPWWGHDDHIHVRLGCPAGSATCVSQSSLDPKKNGCDKDLEWWFSKEADDKWKEILAQPSERVFPVLPEACAKMLL